MAAPFTTFGCPYPSALAFLRDLAHTGDSVPLSAGRDIYKFDSEAATWATPTHVTSMVHAAAAAAARGLAGATKEYCLRRLADRYIVRAVETAPPLVPRPGSWWRVMWCVGGGCVAPYIELQLQKSVISKNTCTSPPLIDDTLLGLPLAIRGNGQSSHHTSSGRVTRGGAASTARTIWLSTIRRRQ